MKALLLFFVLLIPACGADSKQVGDNATVAAETPKKDAEPTPSTSPIPAPADVKNRSMYVADASALPTCDAASEGALAYVNAEKKFKACLSAAWTDIEPTPATKMSGSIGCAGTLENTVISFTYVVAQFTSGDVFVSGSIVDPRIQASGSVFYAAQQNGFANAPIIITLDEANAADAGYWKISLDRTTLVTTIAYNDGADSLSWTMTPDKCVANKY